MPWLEELGFNEGDMVSITTSEKLLNIELQERGAKVEQEYKNALQDVKLEVK